MWAASSQAATVVSTALHHRLLPFLVAASCGASCLAKTAAFKLMPDVWISHMTSRVFPCITCQDFATRPKLFSIRPGSLLMNPGGVEKCFSVTFTLQLACNG